MARGTGGDSVDARGIRARPRRSDPGRVECRTLVVFDLRGTEIRHHRGRGHRRSISFFNDDLLNLDDHDDGGDHDDSGDYHHNSNHHHDADDFVKLDGSCHVNDAVTVANRCATRTKARDPDHIPRIEEGSSSFRPPAHILGGR